MDPTTITGVVLIVIALISLLVTLRQLRLSRSDHEDSQLHETIKQVISEANEPLKQAVNACTAQLSQQGEHVNRVDTRLEQFREESSKDFRGLSDKVTEMGVKVDMYWSSILGKNGSGVRKREE